MGVFAKNIWAKKQYAPIAQLGIIATLGVKGQSKGRSSKETLSFDINTKKML
jgi:hypothetical protein